MKINVFHRGLRVDYKPEGKNPDFIFLIICGLIYYCKHVDV